MLDRTTLRSANVGVDEFVQRDERACSRASKITRPTAAIHDDAATDHTFVFGRGFGPKREHASREAAPNQLDA